MSIEASEQKPLAEFMAGYAALNRKRNRGVVVKFIPPKPILLEPTVRKPVCPLVPVILNDGISSIDLRDAVIDAFELTLEEFLGGNRARRIVRARQCFCWIYRHNRPETSYPQLGRLVGNTNHSTVIKGIERFESLKHQYAHELKLISERLGA